jgi:hypothetical protein
MKSVSDLTGKSLTQILFAQNDIRKTTTAAATAQLNAKCAELECDR